MGIRKYKFTDKHHTVGGIFSMILGMASVAIMYICVRISYESAGNAGGIVGGLGLFAMALSMFGCISALLSFKEKDKYYFFSKVGSYFCGILTVLYMAVFLMGI